MWRQPPYVFSHLFLRNFWVLTGSFQEIYDFCQEDIMNYVRSFVSIFIPSS